MTIQTYSDSKAENIGKSLSLGFESTEAAMLAGIRVRCADLARLLGVTKQAVSSWVKDGRITLGADGRVDPREAVNRLIATGDPARLRAIFLKPLVTELATARHRVFELEQALEAANDDAKFHEDSASGLLDLFDAFKITLEIEWENIRALPPERGRDALLEWLDAALEHGPDPDFTILDMAARSVAEEDGSGYQSVPNDNPQQETDE